MLFRSTIWGKLRHWFGKWIIRVIVSLLVLGMIGGVITAGIIKLNNKEIYQEFYNGKPDPEPLYATTHEEIYE